MATSNLGGVPRGGKRRDDELSGKIPEPMIAFNDVKAGMTALAMAKIRLLGSDGTDQTAALSDSIRESTPDRFNALIKDMGFDEKLMARLIADAISVDKLPQDSVVYLEGLALEAERIAEKKGTTYTKLPRGDRLKLAGFLFRPANERPLTIVDRLFLLFPDFTEQVPPDTEVVDWSLKVNRRGLRKVLRCMIESEGLEQPPMESTYQLWREHDWERYAEHPGKERLEIDERGSVVISTFDIKPINSPLLIEYLLSGVRECIGDPYNLEKILDAAEKVLPKREELEQSKYFKKRTSKANRHAMLRGILGDK